MTVGKVAWYGDEDPGDRFGSDVRAELDLLYGGAAGAGVAPEAFGAIGDGTSDDTEAMQEWIAEVQQGGVNGVLSANKNYLITEELEIDDPAGNWAINGRGSTITQNTDGLSVFRFTVPTGLFDIRRVHLAWTNQQNYLDETIGIAFDRTGTNVDGWWGFILEDITFHNGYHGVQTIDNNGSNINVVWDCLLNRVRAFYGCTGTTIKFANGLAGQTGIHILDCYQHRETSSEPVVDIANADALKILNLKMDGENASAENGVKLSFINGGELSGRQERGHLGDGDTIISCTDVRGLNISSWSVQAIQSYTGANHSLVKFSVSDWFAGLDDMRADGNSVQGVALSTYSPHPDFPASFAVAEKTYDYDDDDYPTPVITSVSAALQGSAIQARPALPVIGGGTGDIEDDSVGPEKLTANGTVRNGTKFYRDDGTWQTVSTSGGSGGGATVTARKGTLMALGHSLMAIMPSYSTSQDVCTHMGVAGHGPGDFMTLANMKLGSPFEILGSAATVGYTIEQIISTHLPVVEAAKPEYCVVWAPMANNMLASGEWSSTLLAKEISIYDRLRAVGTTPIVATCPPAANGTNTGLSKMEIQRYNSWIANYSKKKGYPFFDAYAALVDPSTGTYYESPTDFATDNTHPSAYGAAALVPVFQELLAQLPSPGSRALLACYNETVAWQASNPLMAGTLGANVPTGYAKSSGMTCVLAAGTAPSKGNKVTLTGTTAFDTFTCPSLAGAVNNEWEHAVRWATTPAAGGGWGLVFYDQSGNLAGLWGATNLPNPTQLTRDKPHCARGKYVSGDSSLTPVFFTVANGSAMELSQNTLRNLSAAAAAIGL